MNSIQRNISKKKKKLSGATAAAGKLVESQKKAPVITDVSASGLKETITEHETAKPIKGIGSYERSLRKTVNEIANREPFSYDLDGDALYRRYKNEYLTAGDRAMRDTIGAISSQSGGYSSSYAQTAGAQAYGAEIERLADIVPDLYSLALDRYTAEGDDLAQRYSVLSDADGEEYDRYRDEVEDWYLDASRLSDLYESERDYEYDAAIDERDYDYQLSRDATEDAQWLAELEEQIRQYDASLAEKVRQFSENLAEERRQYDASLAEGARQYDAGLAEEKRQHDADLAEDARQHAASLAQKSSSSSSSSSSSGGTSAEKRGSYTPSEQAKIMEELDGYRQDFDVATDERGRSRAINRALAYLSGLEFPEYNAYFFEKIFGFVPEEYGGSGDSFHENYGTI